MNVLSESFEHTLYELFVYKYIWYFVGASFQKVVVNLSIAVRHSMLEKQSHNEIERPLFFQWSIDSFESVGATNQE